MSSRRAPVDEVLGLQRRYGSGYSGWNVKHFHAWPVVEFVGDSLDLGKAFLGTTGSLVHVLTDESDRVLAGSALSWAARIGEIHPAAKRLRHSVVAGELHTVIDGDATDGQVLQRRNHGVRDRD